PTERCRCPPSSQASSSPTSRCSRPSRSSAASSSRSRSPSPSKPRARDQLAASRDSPPLRLFGQPILEDDDAGVEDLLVRQLEAGLVAAVCEQARSLAEHDRVQHEPVQVDQLRLGERVEQPAAAGEEQILAGLILQLADLGREVALDEDRAAPVRRLE